jgi:hypothetical protein
MLQFYLNPEFMMEICANCVLDGKLLDVIKEYLSPYS